MAFGYALVDVNGSTRLLDGSLGVTVKRGASGLAFPDISPASDKLPYAPGGVLRRLTTNPGKLSLPLELKGATSAALDSVLDNLRSWIAPGTERASTPSIVSLQVTRDDGAQREIRGVATLSVGDDAAGGLPTWHRTLMTLYAHDPYWRDVAATTFVFTIGSGVENWFPYWPYDMNSSAVIASQVVANAGNVEAWPTWTIQGPGSSLTLTNATTGDVLSFSGVVFGASDVVTVDTNEGVKTALLNGVTNLWPYATTSSEMWPLGVGNSTVTVSMASADARSSVSLSYRRRWLGGHR